MDRKTEIATPTHLEAHAAAVRRLGQDTKWRELADLKVFIFIPEDQMSPTESEVRIIITTDAAGEGSNLQRAHLMVSYDLPWNTNRLGQRFGCIYRIGQAKTFFLWNLVA
ncbi:MAG: C-terminal helicase domain-containing protein, partial [Spirochaetales bacterium]|nr:C-terminal helicase domain-containing protein [Spirochaetales bacterium]